MTGMTNSMKMRATRMKNCSGSMSLSSMRGLNLRKTKDCCYSTRKPNSMKMKIANWSLMNCSEMSWNWNSAMKMSLRIGWMMTKSLGSTMRKTKDCLKNLS